MANSPILYSPINPHFFQPLLPGFHAHLNIPVAFFSAHIEGRNERNIAELRSDAFDKTWKVKLEDRRLTHGWKDFAVAHGFRVGDFVVLRYERDLKFYVTAFGPSCCELQYLHSRKSSIEQDLETESASDDEIDSIGTIAGEGIQVNKINQEAESSSLDKSCFVSHITDSNLQVDTLFLPRRLVTSGGLKRENRRIVLMNKQGGTWTANLRYRESSGSFFIICGWRNFCEENGLKSGDSITWKLENNKETPVLTFSSAESNNAHQQKIISCKRKSRIHKNSSSEDRFVTFTVTPYNYKSCRLYVPLTFSRINKMEKAGKKITLVDKNGVEWPANVLIEKESKRLVLGKGWKEFCRGNEIQIKESFVMELVWEDKRVAPILKFCSKVEI